MGSPEVFTEGDEVARLQHRRPHDRLAVAARPRHAQRRLDLGVGTRAIALLEADMTKVNARDDFADGAIFGGQALCGLLVELGGPGPTLPASLRHVSTHQQRPAASAPLPSQVVQAARGLVKVPRARAGAVITEVRLVARGVPGDLLVAPRERPASGRGGGGARGEQVRHRPEDQPPAL